MSLNSKLHLLNLAIAWLTYLTGFIGIYVFMVLGYLIHKASIYLIFVNLHNVNNIVKFY